MKFWEDSDRAMESFDFQSWIQFTRDCLLLGQESNDVQRFVCRFGNFSVEVWPQISSVGTGEDRSPLNVNAKVFQKPVECVKKQGAKDPKDSIEKIDWKIRLGKARRA